MLANAFPFWDRRLGLTISARFIALMGGRIWVESEPDRGTQFHFTIHAKPAREKIAIKKFDAPEGFQGVKGLIVDDNHTNRRILCGMFERWGMRPVAVEGAEEALAAFRLARDCDAPFSLVLTDMHMPHMDGFTTIKKIREESPQVTPANVMLTSAGHRGDAERCKQLGVAGYLLKPVRQSELHQAIAMILGARQNCSALPLVTRYSVQDASEPDQELSILVAEDNAVNQRLVARMLEKRGHRVALAGNGREALDALAREEFDVVLMDVQMPEMDGLTAVTLLRQRQLGSSKHQVVIALTAHAMRSDEELCLAAGMDGYVTKPIRPGELDATLSHWQGRDKRSVTSPVAPETSPSRA